MVVPTSLLIWGTLFRVQFGCLSYRMMFAGISLGVVLACLIIDSHSFSLSFFLLLHFMRVLVLSPLLYIYFSIFLIKFSKIGGKG